MVEVFSAGTSRDEAAALRPGFDVQDAADGRLFVVRPIPRGEVDATVLEIPRRSPAGPLPDALRDPHDPNDPSGSLEPAEPETGPVLGPARPASVRIGSRVAHYRILEEVGRGGMGVVYRAEDTRLRRTVALKFLPSGLTRNQVAKSLFLKEARAASALDHDNLCTIHEVGEAGEAGETELYLAMAFYGGETVRAKIDRGPLPVAAAVDIARQAAQGLAKAHRLGIVHRDIKPANLMVTNDGVVKILDFGIAKLAGAADAGQNRLPPGTPAYMSPEQAGGDEVDARADVWSLGIVLHEMLTGARPVDGRIRTDLPAELQRVLGRMLAPSLADRHPTAAEALADLQAAQASLANETHRRQPWLWIAAIVLLGGALGAGLWLSRNRTPSVLGEFDRLTDLEGLEEYPSVSPDGTSFVFVRTTGGQRDIYGQKVDGHEAVLLTPGSPVDDSQPAFSPDGRSLAFRSERDGGGIFLMTSSGGLVRRIADFGHNPAWSPDGREIAVATEGIVDPSRRYMESRIWRVDVATGRRRQVTRSDGVQPSWSPNGRRIAFWGLSADRSRRILWTVAADGAGSDRPDGSDGPGIASIALDDGHLNWNPVWSPDGDWIYFGSDRNGSLHLWRLAVDQRSGEVRGKPELVPISSQASGFWSLTSDGKRIVYAANESKSNLDWFPFDPQTLAVTGAAVPVTRGSQSVRSCDVSPDGRSIVFHAGLPQEDLFRIRLDGTGLRRLTHDRFKDRQPFWAPDGRRILFYSDRGGSYQGWILDLTSGALEPILKESGPPLSYPVWAPDGRKVAATFGQRSVVVDLARPLPERTASPLLPNGSAQETFQPTAWSDDGDRLAGNVVRLTDSGSEGIGIFSLESGTYRRLTDRGLNPVWLHGGTSLLYTDSGAIQAFDLKTGRALSVLQPGANTLFTAVAQGPDQRKIFAVRNVAEGDVWMLTFH